MHLVNGTGNSPSPGQPTPGVVKRDKSSGGSVDTTKTRSHPQRVRMSSGGRPIGAAKGKQSDTKGLCQSPPPTHPTPGKSHLLSTPREGGINGRGIPPFGPHLGPVCDPTALSLSPFLQPPTQKALITDSNRLTPFCSPSKSLRDRSL